MKGSIIPYSTIPVRTSFKNITSITSDKKVICSWISANKYFTYSENAYKNLIQKFIQMSS